MNKKLPCGAAFLLGEKFLRFTVKGLLHFVVQHW